MWTYWLGTARRLSLLTVLLLLTACGGGGGGDGGPAPVAYSGNTSAATVTPTNASKLTANVIGGNDTATIIVGVSIENGDAAQDLGGGLMDLGLRLNRDFRNTVSRAEQARSTEQAVNAVIPVDVTDQCDGGSGSVRTSGTLADNGTGTLSVNFNNCFLDGVTLNGPATLRVDAFDLANFIPTDFTMSFSRLTLRGVGLSVDTSGSLRAQLDIGTQTETITANLVSLNNNNGETAKTENLEIVNVYNNIFSPTSFVAIISGRVFDQVHGYVDVTTDQLLVFGTLTQLFPDSGQLLLTGAPAGAGNHRIRVTALLSPPAALPATLARLELDLDGDNTYEIDARLKWTDLSSPVGSDLGDTDLDGMHNSWETANGLNPGVDDAAGNMDGDAFTNLEEYLAGTDPSDALSHP